MDYLKPIIVAEIGCNHQGDFNLAKKLISQAKISGANYVKFQKRDNKYLLGKKFSYPHPVPENSFGTSYGKHREYLEFNIKQHEKLYNFCKKVKVKYSTSVWDKKSAIALIKSKIDLDFLKIPSACNLDFELLEIISSTFYKKIHISTGMTTKKEIDQIIDFFIKKKRNKDLVVYHCTSSYPANFEDVCLKDITNLIKIYGKDINSIGFSGHHQGIAIDISAYTLGARIIERHFTLDRSMKGTDHSASLEPTGLFKLCRDLNNTYKSLKSKKGKLLFSEKFQRKKLKRIIRNNDKHKR